MEVSVKTALSRRWALNGKRKLGRGEWTGQKLETRTPNHIENMGI